MYTFYFLVRRFLTIMILIYMRETPYFQSSLLMILSIVNFSYLIANQPLYSQRENTVEMFNEVAIYLSFLLQALMQNIAIPLPLSNTLGSVMIVVAVQNIMINLCLTCYNTFKKVRTKIVEKCYRKRALLALERQIENRQDLA